MLDINCAWNSVEEGIAFCHAVASMNVAWVEEPTWPPEDFTATARVRAAAGCGIAGGENAGSPADFANLLAARALDVAQPSVTKVGGLSAMLEVAAQARAAGIRMVPHCPYFGPGLLASLHLLAANPTEEPIEIYFADLAAAPYGAALDPQDGFITVPTGRSWEWSRCWVEGARPSKLSSPGAAGIGLVVRGPSHPSNRRATLRSPAAGRSARRCARRGRPSRPRWRHGARRLKAFQPMA